MLGSHVFEILEIVGIEILIWTVIIAAVKWCAWLMKKMLEKNDFELGIRVFEGIELS